jgi:tetratricopeptide (TPR) repeat protein
MNLGKILTIQKKFREALQEFEEAEKLSWKTWDENFNPIPVVSQYWIGIALAEKGDFEGARKKAGQLKELIEKGNYDKLHLDFYHLLLGEIEISQQNGQAALDALDKLTFWTHLVSPDALKIKASSLALIEDNEKAIEASKGYYANVQLFKYGMSDPFVFFYERSLADYNIAKIYEKMGNTAQAIEHYQKFLDLMKAAYPGITEVEDAKTRLANLK